MAKESAGLMLWKRESGALRVLLVHLGGPFWAKRDAGAWTIPKGEFGADETPLAVARREFAEELGVSLEDVSTGEILPLGSVRQAGGKTVTGFAAQGDLDAAAIVSNTFELEWPPRSGRRRTFPEVDRAAWFSLAQARERINPAQAAFLDALEAAVGADKPNRK
ncbi:MAG: NUDIX domain-containing protein [Pseudolabrys sp.]